MLKISDEHSAAFDALAVRERAIQLTLDKVMRETREAHAQLLEDSRALWKEVMAAYRIEGLWTHKDGQLHPVTPPQASSEPVTAV